jgi:hypothetical protein
MAFAFSFTNHLRMFGDFGWLFQPPANLDRSPFLVRPIPPSAPTFATQTACSCIGSLRVTAPQAGGAYSSEAAGISRGRWPGAREKAPSPGHPWPHGFRRGFFQPSICPPDRSPEQPMPVAARPIKDATCPAVRSVENMGYLNRNCLSPLSRKAYYARLDFK